MDDITNFRQKVSEAWERFENEVIPQIEKRYATDGGLGETATGRGVELAHEAITRRYLIDPLLGALGWTVTAIETMMVEAPVQHAGQHRRFMDYHGYEVETGDPLLLIEAKRLSAELPRPRLGRGEQPPNKTLSQLIAEAINVYKSPREKGGGIGNVMLIGDWPQWIDDISGYLKGLHHQRKNVPSRVLITNGDWIILFENVEDAFISESHPAITKIHIFEDHRAVIENAPQLLEKLAYAQLSKYIPPQHPSALHKFLNGMEEITCSHALLIYYDLIAKWHHARPRISVALVILVLSSRGVWVRCEKDEYEKHFFELPYDKEKVHELGREIESQGTLFISEIGDMINKPVRLLSAAEFGKESASSMNKDLGDKQFLLVTGQFPSLFSLDGTYDACPYHNWPKCREEGNAAGDHQLFSPSLNPRAYFPSGNPFHCAHVRVHNLRITRCKVQGFEVFLCCRRCVYFELCWHEDAAQLPCRNN